VPDDVPKKFFSYDKNNDSIHAYYVDTSKNHLKRVIYFFKKVYSAHYHL
jgi:hypothetical protein